MEAEEDPPMEIIPGYLDVETLATSVIVALLMMPCDRLFIGMFAKIRPPGLAVEGTGVTGKAYSLPRVTPTEDELVRKLQAKFRGNQQRQKLRSMNAVMESYLFDDVRAPRNKTETVLLAANKFDKRKVDRNRLVHMRKMGTLNAEDRDKQEHRKSTLDASQVFQGPTAPMPPRADKFSETRGAAGATLMLSGAEFKRTRAFPTTAKPSIRVGGGADAGKRNAMIAAGTMLSTARRLGKSGGLSSHSRSLSPTRSPRRFSSNDDDGATVLQDLQPEPEPELDLDEPAGRSNLVGRRASLVTTTFSVSAREDFEQSLRLQHAPSADQQRLQGGTPPIPLAARANSALSSTAAQRASHTMPTLLPKMSDAMP